jgi:hypothetical protein
LPYFEDIRERGGVYLAALNSRRIAVFQSDPLLLNWMICRDLVAPGERVMNWIATPKFCIESEFGGRVAGAAMDAIDEIMVDDRGRSDVMRSVRRWMNEHLVKFDEFDWNRAERVAQLIGEHVELFYKYTEHENVGLLLRENPADAELVIWIGMLLWEHADGPHEFHEYVNERLAWEGGFEELGAARVRRRSKKRKKNTFDPTTMGVSEEFAEYFESWLQGASVINA